LDRACFDISEQFDTVVMLRSTTRLSHGKSAVEVEVPKERGALPPLPKFDRNPQKYVIIPAHAKLRHPIVEDRILKLKAYAETTPLNRVEWGDKKIGVITGGVAYQYAREVFQGYSIFEARPQSSHSRNNDPRFRRAGRDARRRRRA